MTEALIGIALGLIIAGVVKWRERAEARQGHDAGLDWPMGMDAHVPPELAKHVTRPGVAAGIVQPSGAGIVACRACKRTDVHTCPSERN